MKGLFSSASVRTMMVSATLGLALVAAAGVRAAAPLHDTPSYDAPSRTGLATALPDGDTARSHQDGDDTTGQDEQAEPDDGAPDAEKGEDKDDKESRAERLTRERTAAFLKRYEPTGKTMRCVPMRPLRGSQALDDQTIVFETLGRSKAYRNRLLSPCIRLLQEDRFIFDTFGTQLCQGEILTVIDVFGIPWGSCALGPFEVYKRRPKEKKKDKDGK